MTRTSDLVRKELKDEKEPLRLSGIEELRSGADQSAGLSLQEKMQIQLDNEIAGKIYMSLQDFILEVKEKVSNNQTIPLEAALLHIRKLIDAGSLLESIYQLTLTRGHSEDYSISHPVNVMVYALKIGLRIGYSHVLLTELALAALLYDIGMLMIPDNILLKKEALTEAEISLVKRHAEMGRNALYAYRTDYPWLLRAVYEHHERENGQGYPIGLKGDQISEYAKIIGICDSYEAMTHDRPHKKALMQFASVRELVETKNRMFSIKILKAFLEEISLYPIGSYVKLNNNVIGRVIATNSDHPLKPIINILFDSHGNRIEEDKSLNLKEEPVLVITSGVTEDELPH
jgi:HD-GYP domain-containing protein (c-di-GMP phosphodiesterase class II)